MIKHNLSLLQEGSFRHNMAAYLGHIKRNNQHDLTAVIPFEMGGMHMGYIAKPLAAHLLHNQAGHFQLLNNNIVFSDAVAGFDDCTAYFEALLQSLQKHGLIEQPREEFYSVAPSFGEQPLFKIRRGASAYFGFKNYGVHLNAYVQRPDGLYMWIARRSGTKKVAPLKLDQMVAGGHPHGLSVFDNLVKESAEEANLTTLQLQDAVSCGVIHYCRQSALKFRRDYIFVYDLELTDDFLPENRDGEVESFYLMPLQEVIAHLEAPDDFKFNTNLVLIDFLIRHGLITPDEPGYMNLIEQLYHKGKWT